MTTPYLTKALTVLLCGTLIACASVPEDSGFSEVKSLLEDRSDHQLHWNKGTRPDQEVAAAVDRLLAEELTPDAAVQIALLNSPALQAVYEDLGVSQADVVAAGLLENPTLFGQVRFPDGSDGAANLEFGIAQNFLNILMLPARKRLAAIEFERQKLHAADAVLRLAADVRKAYFTAVAAAQTRELQRQKAAAAENAFELALRMNGAGNLDDLALAERQAGYEQARIDLAGSEEAVLESRENLNRLLGLWGDRTEWRAAGTLPELPVQEMSLEGLESTAVANRLDLASARREVDALAEALGITVDWRWVGEVEVGISTERETDRTWLTGPSLSIQLPLFHQHQADIARLEARLRQSYQRMTSQAVEIRSEVRTLRDRLVMKRRLAEHYEKTVLPLRQRIVSLTLQKYNYMLAGAFDLLEAKQAEIAARQDHSLEMRDYWIIRSELQRALGGKLNDAAPAGSGMTSGPVPDEACRK